MAIKEAPMPSIKNIDFIFKNNDKFLKYRLCLYVVLNIALEIHFNLAPSSTA